MIDFRFLRLDFRLALLLGLLALLATPETVVAQQIQPNFVPIQVQLPTTNFFRIDTVVSVPDGGSMSLGGVSSSGYRSSTYGTPLLGGLPGVGRPFRNQSISGFNSASNATVRAKIILNHEIDEDLVAEGLRRQRLRETTDPNGSLEIQRRADFLSRNIGRR